MCRNYTAAFAAFILFKTGTSFSCIDHETKMGVKNKRTIVKAFTKTVLDFCILPGTSGGAEILWVYSMQWKKHFTLIAVALLSFVYSHIPMRESFGKSFSEPENTR
jgi:hypothetical protein